MGVPVFPAVVVAAAVVVGAGLVVVVVSDAESFEHAAPNSDSAAIAVNTASRVIVR
ncbi:hypothetical protein AB0L57_08985 [Nocardia sp. NPDC052254]|uniref:hypothetical protein n=1 Tax=Nocardia sp. NPDC052254 TaxID=3155681 RepID=UPI00342D30C8